MSLNSQARFLLDAVKASGVPELCELTPEVAREEYLRRTARAKEDVEIFQVEDREIPGPMGGIKVRI